MTWQQPRKPGIPVEVKGTCPVCGKPATVKSRIDSAYPNGGVKTLEAIAAEEAVLRSRPVTHIKCNGES
ncbi:MAG: hypothetical protein ACR2OE_15005 [Thermomicrobiales bacterium]